jgi:hypothetical protein
VHRVCPRCGRISQATGRRCPYCRGALRRPGLGSLATLLAIFAVGILAGVGAMLLAFGDRLDDELDRSVRTVERDFDREVRGLQRDIREELDRRLPRPTPTPVP